MDKFLQALRDRLAALLDERSAVDDQANALFSAAEAEARTDLLPAEAEQLATFRARIAEIGRASCRERVSSPV